MNGISLVPMWRPNGLSIPERDVTALLAGEQRLVVGDHVHGDVGTRVVHADDEDAAAPELARVAIPGGVDLDDLWVEL